MKLLNVILLSAVGLFCVGLMNAQVPCWEWSVQAGGLGYDYGRAIVLDSAGNQYVSGYFQNSVSFGSTTLISSGNHDLFAAKLDVNGNFLWAKRFGGIGDDYGRSIALDAVGNVYVSGYFEGTGNFGSINLFSSGGYDLCVIKLNNNGDVLWANRAGGPGSEWADCVKVDDACNVYLTGHFTETAIFGDNVLVSNGNYDLYAAKLDPNGNFLWAVQAGGVGIDQSLGLALDDSYNICLTGNFQDTITLGDYVLTSNGGHDIFAAKLDNNGNWIWAKRAGGAGDDFGLGIAVLREDVYLTGCFSGTANFGATTITSNGVGDIFATKLDIDGNFLWTARAGGESGDRSDGITVDAEANVYLTGSFSDVCAFGNTMLSSRGSKDIFAAKLDSDGSFTWAFQAGGTDNDQGYALALDDSCNIYLTGFFRYDAYFGSNYFYGNGSEDIYVAKLGVSESNLPLVLSSFTTTLILNNTVMLNWVTMSETNMLGYNILRSNQYNPETATVCNDGLIPATNTSLTHTYTFSDYDILLGNTYYYWLEAVSIDSNYFFGPQIITLMPSDMDEELNPELSRIVNAWPNPFRQNTGVKIEVAIKTGETGTAAVYNLRGQKLREYSLEAGYHTFTWNGRDSNGKACNSGVYFLKLNTTSLSQTRKLLIVK